MICITYIIIHHTGNKRPWGLSPCAQAEKIALIMRRLVGAYLEGRPTELSSVDGWGWVKKLKCVFETKAHNSKM